MAENSNPTGVHTGTLFMHGGGILNKQPILQRVNKQKMVIIPTATKQPNLEHIAQTAQDYYISKIGFAEVVILHTESREEANDDNFVEPLRDATFVFFHGGCQWRLGEFYAGTLVEKEVIGLLHRGGVVLGTSAGAAICSRVMIKWGKEVPVMGVGFRLMVCGVVDQHFKKRNRAGRLRKVLRREVYKVGYGVDEGTSLVVSGKIGWVEGTSSVTVMFANSRTKEYFHGEKFHFVDQMAYALKIGDAIREKLPQDQTNERSEELKQSRDLLLAEIEKSYAYSPEKIIGRALDDEDDNIVGDYFSSSAQSDQQKQNQQDEDKKKPEDVAPKNTCSLL